MSKLDKKIMSIFVVLILLASFIMPSISLAAEEEIVIKDSALKEALDKNKDGKVTKQEVEETRYISISKDVKNLDGLEHATNLESMDIEYVGQSYDFSKLNLCKFISSCCRRRNKCRCFIFKNIEKRNIYYI